MIAFRRILVPTNLGAPSKEAIRYGVALAQQFGARLFLLHVLRTDDYDAAVEAERVLEKLVPESGDGIEPSPDDVVRTVARADLESLLTAEEERETRAEFLLRPSGPDGPHSAIAECAREAEIDLLVMGKHGIGRLEHMLGGSVTEKVMRHAPCPVLVIRQPGPKPVQLDDVRLSAAER
jgi:nucleotide-binding universal stress UspA family protein